MCAGYLESLEWWDRPNVYWPGLTFGWIVMFLFYIWTKNIWNFYIAIAGSVGLLSGIYTRNYLRKKMK